MGHVDSFERDNLPLAELWPDLPQEGFAYPKHLNARVERTDAMVAKGSGDRTALIGNGWRRPHKELSGWTNRIARVPIGDLGIRPGSGVLIPSANNPAMVAAGWRRPRPGRWWSTPRRCCAPTTWRQSQTRRRSAVLCTAQG